MSLRRPVAAGAGAVTSGASGAGDLDLSAMEQEFIRLALERTDGNRTEAARLLGISRRTLQRKLKELPEDG